MTYGLLEGEVASWNVAMICVPEQGVATLLGIAVAGWLLLRRRRTIRCRPG